MQVAAGGNVQRIGFHYEVGGEEIFLKRKGQRPQPLHAFLVPLCFHLQRDKTKFFGNLEVNFMEYAVSMDQSTKI